MLSYNTYEPTHDPFEVVAWCPLGPRSPDDVGADPSRHRGGQERIGRARGCSARSVRCCDYPGSLYRFAERRGGPGRRRRRQSSVDLIAHAKTITTMTTAMVTARLLVLMRVLGAGLIVVHG
jgi:hypothetical protein